MSDCACRSRLSMCNKEMRFDKLNGTEFLEMSLNKKSVPQRGTQVGVKPMSIFTLIH